jgi:hypothetical protein
VATGEGTRGDAAQWMAGQEELSTYRGFLGQRAQSERIGLAVRSGILPWARRARSRVRIPCGLPCRWGGGDGHRRARRQTFW